jgi:branched-chain amino acid transport system permease protein
MKKMYICFALFILAMAVGPSFLNPYWVDVLNNIGIYAILALSLNFILGHAGMFHMGHAAFFAVGAYITAILNTMYHIPIIWLMPLSGIAAALFAAVVARPIIHLRGDYLLIVTIGIVEIVRIALVNDIFGVTGGANGIFGIGRPEFFGLKIRRPHQFYYYIWIFLGISVLLFRMLEDSRFGRALNCIKEDELAAEGCGINTAHYKLIAFVLGAFWAGMVGNIYASKMMIISPESFSFWESVLYFTIVILGGSGSIPGVILGAFLIVGLPEIFRQFASARMLIFGAAMVIMMIFRPSGILPPLPRIYKLHKENRRESES